MNKVVIFGNGQVAEVAHWYVRHTTSRLVTAFTVDGVYVKEGAFHGVPVVPFETIQDTHPPKDHLMLVMASYQKVNRLRQLKYEQAREKGYGFYTYVHPAVANNAARIGENCFIFEDNVIQPFVSIGNDCILWSGNHIGHHTRIGNHVFIASHVVVSGSCEIGDNTFIGVNATLRDNISIGSACVIGAGALALHHVADDTVLLGHEAIVGRKKSYQLRGI
jgi:sugar O-acyltransferase (sialic acid O-acetyltransferase NeuD family)